VPFPSNIFSSLQKICESAHNLSCQFALEMSAFHICFLVSMNFLNASSCCTRNTSLDATDCIESQKFLKRTRFRYFIAQVFYFLTMALLAKC